MRPSGGATVGLGGSEVVFLEIAQDLKDRLRIEAAPGQDGDEQ